METDRPGHRRRPLLIALTALLLLSGIYFAGKSGADPQVYSNDFNVYYFAAREVIAGRDPYQNSLGAWTTYIYPPLLAELITPLAMLPLPVAAYVWFLMSAASILAAAWMSASLAVKGAEDHGDRRFVIAVAAVALIARFMLDNLHLGQVNNIVAALAVAHIYFYDKRRPVLSAAALALAVSIKLTPAALILYQLARLRLKFASLTMLLLALMTFASLIPFGERAPDVLNAFIDRTIRNEQGFDLAYSGNQSLRGALLRIGGDSGVGRPSTADAEVRELTGAVPLVVGCLVLGLSVFTAVRARSEAAAAAPFFCCMVLLSPLSWKAHFVVLILPLAYLVAQAFSYGEVRGRLIAAALVTVFILFNLTSRLIVGEAASERADARSLVFAGALIIFLLTVWAGVFGKRGGVLLISTSKAGGDKKL